MRVFLLRRLVGVLLLPAAILFVGCGDDAADAPDPSQAPRTNAAALQSDSARLASSVTDPTPVPDVTVTTMDGQTLDLDAQQGSVLLINFWATWCAPCLQEIPDLIELQDRFGDRGLTIVGVALDQEGASVVQPFMERHNINYPVVVDTTRTLESQFGPIHALPTTVVVNPEGLITRQIVGLFPTSAMRPKLETMLAPGA